MMPEPAPLLLLDVGGTDIKAAATRGAGRELGPVLRRGVLPHADPTGEALVGQLAGIAEEVLDGVRPGAAALLIPGIVDTRARRVLFAANLGLRDAPVPDALQRRLGVPVAFGHDVGTAAEAELREGAGRDGAECTLVVVIGTGIASTMFVGEARIDPPGAGELGHVPVPGGLACPCGAHGCLETIASAAGIARAYRALSGASVPGASEVLDRAAAGDVHAAAAWDQAVQALAFALHWSVGLLGVDRIIVGGGLSGAGEALLGPLRDALSARLSYMSMPTIVRARLGGDSGLVGARRLALELEANQAVPAARAKEPLT
jgi:glucokinase